MLPWLDDNLHAKNLWECRIPSRDIDVDDQRILQSDCTRQNWLHPTNSSSLRCYFFDDYLDAKNLRYWLIPFTDIDDQWILQSNWTRGITEHTQPKVVVSDATFLWWLSSSKESKRLLDSVRRHWWLNNTGIWLAESILGHNWHSSNPPPHL